MKLSHGRTFDAFLLTQTEDNTYNTATTSSSSGTATATIMGEMPRKTHGCVQHHKDGFRVKLQGETGPLRATLAQAQQDLQHKLVDASF